MSFAAKQARGKLIDGLWLVPFRDHFRTYLEVGHTGRILHRYAERVKRRVGACPGAGAVEGM